MNAHGAGPSARPSPVTSFPDGLRNRADALLAGDPKASIGELDRVITDACATVLAVRGRQGRIERALAGLVAMEADSAQAAARAAKLAREADDVREELAQFHALIERLMPHRRAWERSLGAQPAAMSRRSAVRPGPA